MTKKLALATTLFALGILAQNSSAQYWYKLQKADVNDRSLSPSFSNDEKKVFYIAPNASGVKNVFSVDLKGGAPVEVTTSTTPIVRLMHVNGKPMIIYMKALSPTSTDYHIFRANNNNTDELDLTPDGEGVRNDIIGSSFNGRYVYYSSNKNNKSKTDFYRYDIPQNLSELIFANDKDFDLIAWSRDQKRLLMQDPSTTQVWNYDINSTDRNQLYVPVSPKKVKQAMLAADNKQLYILETDGSKNELRSMTMASLTETGDVVKPIESGILSADISVNGKYIITKDESHAVLKDAATLAEVYRPTEAILDIQTNTKETLVLQTIYTNGGRALQLYDIAKKTTTNLVMLK